MEGGIPLCSLSAQMLGFDADEREIGATAT